MTRVRTVRDGRDPTADLVGCVIGGVAALSYAVTILIGRSLSRSGVPSATALGFRFGVAALALGAVAVVRRAPVLPAPGERVRLVLLGGVAYALESTLFYLALGRGTAAAAALVFYAYPAIVAVLELGLGSPLPLGRLAVALALSAVGTLAVVAAGQHVAISPAGILFALGAAAVFAVYLIGGERLVKQTDAWTRATWVAAGAAVSSVGRGMLTHSFSGSGGHWAELVAYGAFTTAAFGLMFVALVRLGPTRTAVVMTLEAFFAVVLGAAFLHEELGPTQLAGGLAILVAAALVAGCRGGPARSTPAVVMVPEADAVATSG